MKFLAEVLLIDRSREVSRRYTYICSEDVKVGQRVKVPFGRNSYALALVVSVEEYSEQLLKNKNISPEKLKSISNIVFEKSAFNEYTLEIAKWISEETLCSEIEAIELFFPKGEKAKVDKRIKIKVVDAERLTLYHKNLRSNAKVAKSVLEALEIDNIIYLDELIENFGASSKNIIKKLVDEGIVERIEETLYKELESNYNIKPKKIILNEEQNKAKIFIEKSNKPVLLYGITGSGKTEVYISLINDALKRGQSAIILVPEISLTPQTISRFRNVFGNNVGVLHSKLTDKEKRSQWEQINAGDIKVVIGPRSALFAPVENLGIIIIDECHEDSYKSESTPKYDGVEVALKMSEIYGTKLVLGTATPTVEQYYFAKVGRFDIITLKTRGNASQKPIIEIVDMSKEYGVISSDLTLKIYNALKNDEQIIIFLNRRGFSNYLRCNICGYVHMCKNCDISLNYHKSTNSMLCHYCGYSENFDTKCPSCEKGKMVPTGAGTQKVEEELKRLFPDSNILRMDKDTTSSKGDHEIILNKFKNKEANILIGTQMIGKGLDFPEVTVVGVINADLGLSFPDYRSHEKTFSIINQVIGRTGRGEKVGYGLVQTYDPENYIYEFIENDDFISLYDREIALRENFEYPPFSNIVRIICTSTNPVYSGDTAQKLKDGIDYLSKKKNIDCKALGPTPCLINKIEGKFRWQIIIKVKKLQDFDIIKNIIRYLIFDKKSMFVQPNTFVSVDINPKTII